MWLFLFFSLACVNVDERNLSNLYDIWNITLIKYSFLYNLISFCIKLWFFLYFIRLPVHSTSNLFSFITRLDEVIFGWVVQKKYLHISLIRYKDISDKVYFNYFRCKHKRRRLEIIHNLDEFNSVLLKFRKLKTHFMVCSSFYFFFFSFIYNIGLMFS